MKQESLIYREILEDLEEIKPELLEAQVSKERNIDTLSANLNEKLNDFSPKLMLYGCYNSGKSTLINALLGKEVAKVGDKPETFDVTPYEFGDYVIYDTPGLNAPTEHEEVTKEHYKKCELVLFILSNENVDFSKAYEEIKIITNDAKPVVIVLNNKQGHDEAQTKTLINQIYANLTKIGFTEKEAREMISVYPINAKSALKGKLENKKLLIEKSNIEMLERKINDLLNQSGIKEVINVCNRNIEGFITQTISNIDNAIDNKALREIEERITLLRGEKRSKSLECDGFIKEKLSILQNQIISALNDGEDVEFLLKTEAQRIENTLGENLKTIADEVKSELGGIKRVCEDILVNFDTSSSFNKAEVLTLTGIITAALAVIPHPIAKVAAKIVGALGAIFGGFAPSEEEVQRKQMQNVNRARDIILKIEEDLTKAKDDAIDEIFVPVLEKLHNDIQSKEEHNALLQNLKAKMNTILDKLPLIEA